MKRRVGDRTLATVLSSSLSRDPHPFRSVGATMKWSRPSACGHNPEVRHYSRRPHNYLGPPVPQEAPPPQDTYICCAYSPRCFIIQKDFLNVFPTRLSIYTRTYHQGIGNRAERTVPYGGD
ncbi:hypothetical protein JTE90_021900 [Oedothorax gibbosus]|uniref:Uncharacterized protein n=1 Tax=Oedothorax gibbosus TaxID=931172 RepID=A0AAV6VUM7_9ARAC|nr:hypothetical protein JTE90_021900 [Oedothorax gibbosus]